MLFHACLYLLLQIQLIACLPSISDRFGESLSKRADTPDPNAPVTSQLDGAPRDVYFLWDSNPQTRAVTADGRTMFFTHSSIFIRGTDIDGPLKIEFAIDNSRLLDPSGPISLRVLDMGAGRSEENMLARAGRTGVKLGSITLRNLKIFDPIQGTGVAADALAEDPVYRTGESMKGNLNDCNTFAKRLAGKLNVPMPQDALDRIAASDLYQSRPGFGGMGQSQIKTALYVTTNSFQQENTQRLATTYCPGRKRDAACGTFQKDGNPVDGAKAQSELAGDPDTMKSLGLTDDQLTLVDDDPDLKVPPGKDLTTDFKAQSTLTRAGGVLKAFTAISKEVFSALGIAGTFAGAIFVILDLVKGDWVGAAIGAVGLAAGVAAGLALSGPVGWIVGGLIAALFAILPGLFKETKPWAKNDDFAGIIQRKMFGDAAHTGNEQCQKGTDDTPGNPDCQALYGSGTLSVALGMNNFDAIVILIQYNQGYPMSIKDLAAAFGSQDKIANVKCHNKPRRFVPGRESHFEGDDPTDCVDPTFEVDRTKIKLPNINQMASDVFNRVIPNANGDCKLVSYPGTSNFPLYGQSISGIADAIACGVTADTNGDGVWTGLEGSSNPENSTDHQGGAYVAPPPATPFANLDMKDYGCISKGGNTNQMMCLPPGTYHGMSGDQVAVASKDVDTLTLPSGWTLKTSWKGSIYSSSAPHGHYRQRRNEITSVQEGQLQGPQSRAMAVQRRKTFDIPKDTDDSPAIIAHTWDANVQDGNVYFANDFQAMDTNTDGVAWWQFTAPNDGPNPTCCIFSDVNFGGNVWCAGVGGGNVPDAWSAKAKSITCHDGGQAWIYADSYGDAGGAKVNGDVKDMSSIPYGNDKNFASAVKAMWISAEQ